MIRRILTIALALGVLATIAVLPAIAKPTPLGNTVPGEKVAAEARQRNSEEPTQPQALAAPLGQEATFYHYLANWESFTNDPDGGPDTWRCPYGDCVGLIDMRSIPQLSQPVRSPPLGFGWFVYDVEKPDICTQGNCDHFGIELGIGPDAVVPPGRINTLENFYSITVENNETLPLLIELLTLHGDPTGQSRWRPFTGDGIWLAGTFYTFTDILTPVELSGRWDLIKATRQGDYRKLREESVALGTNTHLKYLDTLERQYPGVSAATFVPPDLPYEGTAVAASSAVESFDCADGELSDGCDLSWTEVSGDFDIVSNEWTITTNGRARAETAMSTGAYMWVQQTFVTTSNNAHNPGTMALVDTSDSEHYTCQSNSGGGRNTRLYRWTGSYTLLATSSNHNISTPNPQAIEYDNEALDCQWPVGTSQTTASDSVISQSNVRAGYDPSAFGGTSPVSDDFCYTDNPDFTGLCVEPAAAAPSGGTHVIINWLSF